MVSEALLNVHFESVFIDVYFATVSLTKTDAKGKDLKKKLVEVLRSAVDEYKGLYVLNFENMRAAKFREIRMDWKESKYVTTKPHNFQRLLTNLCIFFTGSSWARTQSLRLLWVATLRRNTRIT